MADANAELRDSLKEQIRLALEATPVDYGRVVALSNKLAAFDPNFVRFSVDAGHISRLGRELVTRQETAVSELVKNAYDADAARVTIRFLDVDRVGGTLEISDDGNGMTREDLIQGFMRLSSTMKIHAPTSPRFRRHRAGRKGIGRFAAQRLGEHLTIITQTLDSAAGVQVRIDWNEFASDRDLSSIGSEISEVPKERPHGTVLRIENLREHWSEAAIRKASRNVLDLLQPFPLSREESSSEASKLDPGFTVTFKRLVGAIEVVVADERQLLLDHALAVIDGVVGGDGHGTWSVVSRALRLDDKDQQIGPTPESPAEAWSAIRHIRFRAHYFIVSQLPASLQTGIRGALKSGGGIRLYRNGFRVAPYGEVGDDWLGLNESYRSRTLLPPHANDNFFGFVEISDPVGKDFEEASSREGVLNNEAFVQLVSFVSRTILAAVVRISEKRGIKITASQRNWVSAPPATTVSKIRAVAQGLSEAAAHASSSSQESATPSGTAPIIAAVQDLAKNLAEVAEQQEEETRQLLEEVGMLRVLASLGLTIGEFTHEIRQFVPAVQADADYLTSIQSKDPKVASSAQRLAENFASLRTYATYFDRAVSDNVSRDLRSVEIRDVVTTFVGTIAPTLVRAGISIEPVTFDGYRLFTTPMHASEWASILFNFFTNSRKAIKRKGIPGKLSIRGGRTGDVIFLEFADNGDGIPPEYVDRVFNAFFTTASPARTNASKGDHDEVLGTGLGLKIVRDIVAGYGGSVAIVTAPAGYATCFRVEVPAAQLNEIPDSDY